MVTKFYFSVRSTFTDSKDQFTQAGLILKDIPFSSQISSLNIFQHLFLFLTPPPPPTSLSLSLSLNHLAMVFILICWSFWCLQVLLFLSHPSILPSYLSLSTPLLPPPPPQIFQLSLLFCSQFLLMPFFSFAFSLAFGVDRLISRFREQYVHSYFLCLFLSPLFLSSFYTHSLSLSLTHSHTPTHTHPHTLQQKQAHIV